MHQKDSALGRQSHSHDVDVDLMHCYPHVASGCSSLRTSPFDPLPAWRRPRLIAGGALPARRPSFIVASEIGATADGQTLCGLGPCWGGAQRYLLPAPLVASDSASLSVARVLSSLREVVPDASPRGEAPKQSDSSAPPLEDGRAEVTWGAALRAFSSSRNSLALRILSDRFNLVVCPHGPFSSCFTSIL